MPATRLAILLALGACAAPSGREGRDRSKPSDPSVESGSEPSGATGSTPPAFAAELPGLMAEAGVPGLSVALVADGQVVWAEGYGLANTETGAPVSRETPFLLASVSKTVTGVALMQLYEEGYFDLDDPIEGALDFQVQHPVHGAAPITYRQLLTHTSSIRDNWGVLDTYYVEGDSPVPLRDFLANYLDPSGVDYNADRNFYDYAPGQGSDYGNVAVALVGHLVEALTGVPFDRHCEDRLFLPLGMAQTGWHLADFDPAEVASPHNTWGRGQPVEHYGFADYPDGQLRSSAEDMATFLAAFSAGGVARDGTRILQPETVELMLTVQDRRLDPAQGLIWYYETIGGQEAAGHNGGELGTSTDLFFRPDVGVGFVALMNGEPTRMAPVRRLHELLLDAAAEGW